MKVFIFLAVTFFFIAFSQCVTLWFPGFESYISWAPIILVFGLRYFSFYQNLMIILISGVFIDSLGGIFVGPTIILLLFSYLILINTDLISQHSYRSELIFWVMPVSLGYNFMSILFYIIFLHNYFSLTKFILGPVINSIVSLIFFEFVVRILSIFRLFDKSDWVKIPLGKRS